MGKVGDAITKGIRGTLKAGALVTGAVYLSKPVAKIMQAASDYDPSHSGAVYDAMNQYGATFGRFLYDHQGEIGAGLAVGGGLILLERGLIKLINKIN